MPATQFKITPTPPTSLKLEPGQEGKFSFTVESLAAPDKSHDLILQALLVGQDGKGKEVEWLVAGPQQTLHMTGGKTETVTIIARPNPAGPRGEQTIKLVVADKERPNDLYAESPAVACEIIAPAVATPPRRKPPWWLFAIIGGGIVVVAGVAVLIWKLSSGGGGGPRAAGEPCTGAAAGECDEGLVCDPDARQCLVIGGGHCKPAEAKLCASGECKAEVCAVPLGGTCDPGDRDVVPCRSNSACDPATRRCLGNVGARCKADAECATGSCARDACAIKAPAVKPGDPCETTCPEPLQCSTTTRRCVEQLGRPCSNHNECATGLCEQNVCAEPALLRDCTRDGICGLDQKCIEVQPNLKRCVWQPGHACQSGAECSSKWCNQRICTRDDGRCQSQSDCPAPYLCITSKQRCLLPNGQLCGGHAECDSGFCNNNRCAPSPCVPACNVGWACNNDPSNPKCIRSRIWILERREVPWNVLQGVH